MTTRDPDRPDPEYLATDLYFKLGDVTVSVPAVSVLDLVQRRNASDPLPKTGTTDSPFSPFGNPRWFVTREYKDVMLELAGDPTRPAALSTIRLGFGVYGTHGEHTHSRKICPLLAKEWSHKACRNQLRAELRNLPRILHLSAETGPVHIGDASSGEANVSEVYLSDKTRLPQSEAKVTCDEDRAFCKASVHITDKLRAIWSFDCISAQEVICESKLAAESAEIQEFVKTKLQAD